jgi:hypothetical protein
VGLISIPRNGDRWMIGPCCFCWVEITKQMHVLHADWVCQERFFQFFPPRKWVFFSNDDRQSLLVCEHFILLYVYTFCFVFHPYQPAIISWFILICSSLLSIQYAPRIRIPIHFRICHGGLVLLWAHGLKLDPNGYVN